MLPYEARAEFCQILGNGVSRKMLLRFSSHYRVFYIYKLDYNYNSLWFIKVDVYTVNIGLVTKVQIWCKSSMFWTGAKVSKCKADTTGDMKLFWIILEPCWKRKVQGRRKRKKAVQIGRHFGAILMCRGVGPMMIVLFRTNYLSLRPNLISLYWIKGTI